VITGAGIAATASLGIAGSAQAAPDYYVGSAADTTGATDCDIPANTDCTLRDAIYAANDNTGLDSIHFSSTISGTPIVLGSELPAIDDAVYIFGNGPDQTVISGDDSNRIFDLEMYDDGDVVGMSSLTLTDGYADGAGGAIYNHNAELHVVDSSLTGNTATGSGGAIYDKDAEPGDGEDSTVLYSTIANNHAADDGGGIYGWESVGTIGTSTFSGNSAGGVGGAISAYDGSFVYSSTITGNGADTGGGVAARNPYGYLYNSIVANNLAGEDPDTSGVFYAAFDLVRNPDGATLYPGNYYPGPNLTGVDPQLGALTNNGGDLPTRKPAASSPVVDQGLSMESSDERGIDRPIDIPSVPNAVGGDGGDIGSVELTLAEGPQPGPAPTPTPTPTPQPRPKHKLKKAIKHCKKKFRHNKKKRKKCIKRVKKKARKRARASASSSPWRAAAQRWAATARVESKAAGGHHAFRLNRR
jgi:hypothetical protein